MTTEYQILITPKEIKNSNQFFDRIIKLIKKSNFSYLKLLEDNGSCIVSFDELGDVFNFFGEIKNNVLISNILISKKSSNIFKKKKVETILSV